MRLQRNRSNFLCLVVVLFDFLVSSDLRGSAKETIIIKILCWDGYVTQDHFKEFIPKAEASYNIKLKISLKLIEDETEQFDAARGAFYSIICPSVDIIRDDKYKLISNNLAVAFDLDRVPNIKHIPTLSKLEYTRGKGKVFAIPLAEGPATIYYNANKITEPKSYKALWHGEYKTGITNLPTHVAVGVALGVGVDKKSSFGWEELSKNKRFLEAFGKTIKKADVISTGVFTANQIKDLDLYFGYGFANAESNKKHKTNFKQAHIKEGHGIWRDHFVMTKKVNSSSLTKKVTEEFINYLLSAKNQKEMMIRAGVEAANIKAYSLLSKEDIKLLPHLQNIKDFKKTGFILPSHTKRDRNGIVEFYRTHGGK